MNDINWNESLYKQSVDLVGPSLPAYVIWECICVLTFCVTGFFLYVMANSITLKTTSHGLIFAAFTNDMLQSVLWGVVGCKRLYLSINNLPELTSQFNCMCWMIPIQLTSFSSNFIPVCISFDRMIAVAAPLWYRDHHKLMKLTLVGVTPPLAVCYAVLGLVTSSKTLPNVACTAGQSYPPAYDHVASVVENGAIVLIVLNSLVTCAAMLRRYFRHRRLRSDPTVFKRDIELHIATRLGALIVIFLVSQGACSVSTSAIRVSTLSEARKAALAPISGCLHLSRGMLDCAVYIRFCPEYQTACRLVLDRFYIYVAKIINFKSRLIIISGSSSSSSSSSLEHR